MFIAPGVVRSVWQRNDLENFQKHLKALETKVSQEGLILTKSLFQTLEKTKGKKPAAERLKWNILRYVQWSYHYLLWQQEISVLRVLTDCRYELYLNQKNLDHTKTKSPQPNESVRDFIKLFSEKPNCFLEKRSMNPLRSCRTIWMNDCWTTESCPHSRKYCYRKTPM